jgi:hypothetical protein
MDSGEISPFMVLVSPTKRCGKTSVMILLQYLTPRSELSSNITGPSVTSKQSSRRCSSTRPTNFVKNKTAYVIRNVEVSGEHKPDASRPGHPRRSLRSGVWRTRSKTGPSWFGSSASRRERRSSAYASVTTSFRCPAQRCRSLGGRQLRQARRPHPQVAEALNHRAADNWRPLLAISDLAGGKWPS